MHVFGFESHASATTQSVSRGFPAGKTSKPMSPFQTIYLDILVNDRFYKQLPYRYSPLFVIDERDVTDFILEKLPSLRKKKWTVGFSNNRIAKQ